MSVRRKFYTKNKLLDSLITEDINCEKLQNGRETWRVGQQRRQMPCEKEQWFTIQSVVLKRIKKQSKGPDDDLYLIYLPEYDCGNAECISAYISF